MKGLRARLARLEGQCGNPFADMSDEELEAQVRAIDARLSDAGYPLSPEWHVAWSRGDWRTVQRMIEELRCEILNAASD